jgi:hypothetical protein
MTFSLPAAGAPAPDPWSDACSEALGRPVDGGARRGPDGWTVWCADQVWSGLAAVPSAPQDRVELLWALIGSQRPTTSPGLTLPPTPSPAPAPPVRPSGTQPPSVAPTTPAEGPAPPAAVDGPAVAPPAEGPAPPAAVDEPAVSPPAVPALPPPPPEPAPPEPAPPASAPVAAASPQVAIAIGGWSSVVPRPAARRGAWAEIRPRHAVARVGLTRSSPLLEGTDLAASGLDLSAGPAARWRAVRAAATLGLSVRTAHVPGPDARAAVPFVAVDLGVDVPLADTVSATAGARLEVDLRRTAVAAPGEVPVPGTHLGLQLGLAFPIGGPR